MKTGVTTLCFLAAMAAGCGKAHFQQRTVNTPSTRTFAQCTETRYGDTDCVERVDSDVDGAGYGIGAPLVFPPGRRATYVMAPVVTDGQRLQEQIGSGTPVLLPSDVDHKQTTAIKAVGAAVNDQEARIEALEQKTNQK